MKQLLFRQEIKCGLRQRGMTSIEEDMSSKKYIDGERDYPTTCSVDSIEIPQNLLMKWTVKAAEKNRLSIHGISHITHAKGRLIRLSWILVFLVFLGFLFSMLFNVLKSFASRDIYTVREKIQVNEMLFPAVSFCHTTKLDAILPELSRLQTAIDVENGSESLYKDVTSISRIFLREMSGGCLFGNTSCNFEKDFQVVPVSLYEGVCYKFNPQGTFSQKGEGTIFGLRIILFVNQSANSLSLETVPEVSLVIQPHNTFPFPVANGILVSPGEFASVRLTRTRFSRLQTRYPHVCTNSGFNIYPGMYTTNGCRRSCSVQHAKQKCGGVDAFAKHYMTEEIASLKGDKLRCFYMKQIEAEWMKNVSQCSCPLPCQEDIFTPFVTQSLWPHGADLLHYKKILSNAIGINFTSISDEYIYKNFLMVNVFFNELAYEKVEEVSVWTNEKLVSDIGGQLGIWIGASLFSALELIVYGFVQLKNAVEVLRCSL